MRSGERKGPRPADDDGEGFFNTLKVELSHRFRTRDDARRQLFAYMESI